MLFAINIHLLGSVQENKLGTGDVKGNNVSHIMTLLEIVNMK